MKKLLLFAALLVTALSFSQVGIGTTTPKASAQLDVTSTNKGFLPPRLTYDQKTAIDSPVAGLLIWCSDCGTNGESQVYNGTTWTNISGTTASFAKPSAPTISGATASNAKATVSFDPASNGGSAILDYTVTSTPEGLTATGSSPLLVTGLTNGTSYTFTVVARNAAGNSVASVASGAVTFLATCGVLVANGVTKQFLCHNLGADISLDPHTPVVGLQGAYIQWGYRGPNTTSNSMVDWQTAANTANFAAAPTSGNANAAAISGWNTTSAANASWGATKTDKDPCPTGYRVPTSAEWTQVNSNNTASRTLPFTSGNTQYGSALHYGPNASTKLLTLPAAGRRSNVDGSLNGRGDRGFYWSSTENGSYVFSLYFSSSIKDPVFDNPRTSSFSLRCIAE